uniref:Uncharacterized protein n=1 Tax=Magallana gigas TaxID=29159 RepID=K1PXY1_MAGGI
MLSICFTVQELQDSNSRYEYALAGVVLVLLIVLAYNGWFFPGFPTSVALCGDRVLSTVEEDS